MAKWLGLPVVLVVDASAMARSVAALVHGFCHFDPALRVAGVVFNRIGGPGHLRYLQEALASTPEVAIIGGLPAEELIAIPERHLGLVTAEEQPLASDRIERLVALTEKYLDLDKLLSTTTSPRPPAASEDAPLKGAPTEPAAQSPKVRFGVARDEAFCFYYPDNLELLERAGAELVFFSPMCDGHLPTKLRGVYLGGGYPEVHAQRLAANSSLRQELRWFIERDGVVYAECGGLMYLTEAIRTVEKKEFPMVGVLPATAQMLPRLSAFGYTEVEVRRQNPLLPIGRLRGHEFRYSQLEKRQAFATQLSTMYAVRKRETENPREEGFLYKRCLASYIHLHFGGNPQIAAALVAAARQG
jgi:cobyrinic acid a,c-diamide synthase